MDRAAYGCGEHLWTQRLIVTWLASTERPDRVSNTGFLDIELLDVHGRPIDDPATEFSFFRRPHASQLGDIVRLRLPPNPRRFQLPAFPQVHGIQCRVAPMLYRTWETDSVFFSLAAGQVLRQQFTVARRPHRWQARFQRWAELSDAFDQLKVVLSASGPTRLAERPEERHFDGEAFDDVDDQPSILAKASLLNLYAKLRSVAEPISDTATWFSFVRRILHVRRERLIAVVDPEMGEIVRFIRENADSFPEEYRPANAAHHYKNFPLAYRQTFAPADMFSIKSDEALGNLQLTLAPAKDPGGNRVLLLDVDIDENGALLKHFFDLLKHKFTGGTHPYDIHELLLYTDGDVELGYTLHPAI